MNSKQSRRTVSRPVLTCLSLAAVVFLGCGSQETGPKRYKVTGLVQLDGTPLPDGYIMFEAEDRAVSSDAGQIKDGRYEFESQVGKKKVQISASRPTKKMQEELNPGAGNVPVYEQYLPARYSSEATELRAEVTESGENKFDFELKSK